MNTPRSTGPAVRLQGAAQACAALLWGHGMYGAAVGTWWAYISGRCPTDQASPDKAAR
jgi:hypothetical protein